MSNIKKGRNEILHDIHGEIIKQKEYNINENIYIISFGESKDDIFIHLYNFLCENYYTTDKFKWRYPEDLFKYFLKDAIVILFTNKNKTEICGMIIGKPIDIMHRGNFDFPIISKSIDVNFLCVKKELRGLGICRFLKNVLIKTTIEHDNFISSALFTIGSDKTYNMYSEKRYYSKFLINDVSDIANRHNILQRQLDMYKLNINVYLSVELPDNILTNVKNNIYEDNVKRYDIFQIYDKVNLKDIMKNKEFIKIFITRNNTLEDIVGLVILYHLDFEENQQLFKNVFIYNYFIKNLLSEEFLWMCTEEICRNMGINVIMSTANINNTYLDTGVRLRYYDYNLELKQTFKNGLVTI